MKKILLSVCLFLLIVCYVDGQDTNLEKADSLYKCGKHFEASVWYERGLFEGETSPEICMQAVKGKINCLKLQLRFAEELDFINRSRNLDIPDSFRQHLAYDELLANYLSGRFVNTIEDAKNLDRGLFSFEERKTAKLITILSYNELCRWNQADSAYKEYLATYLNNAVSKEQLGLYLKKPTLKSEHKARVLSNLFPGLGQVYAGKSVEGITNLLLQLGTLWFSAGAWQEGYHLTSLLIGGSSFSAFRSGGKRRAVNLIKKENAKNIDKYNDYLRKQLLLSYTLKTL